MTAFQNKDLVLSVRPDFDPVNIRLDKYEGFIDALCGDREYQKEAIRTACRFLAGGEYLSTEELAAENFRSNRLLEDRYGSLNGLCDSLPFPSKLSCNIDLATGTGKTWVMYGIARILLAAGIVDRVLVLCPSLTIESGLTSKFIQLTADTALRDLLPDEDGFRNPEITNADTTTGPGDICVENIDATYRHVNSSVRDSFGGKGPRTLVLNDEAHHIYSPPAGRNAVKRWMEFLSDSEFDFLRIVGFSGTCYTDNDYFPDVIYRYSLRDAMDQGVVKDVRYVSKDESLTQDERFQKYLSVHRENQRKHRDLKPLSILVAGRVGVAQSLRDDLTKFLSRELAVPLEEASKKVLCVTSSPGDKSDLAALRYVDRRESPVEWIVSVSMLTEGWDVQNVFQIIPHEKRAFASKLLIAQVLGRGLRVPKGTSHPAVWVFNHSSWSGEIERLVDEVLEQERRLSSQVVDSGHHAKSHFDVHQLSYKTHTEERELSRASDSGEVQLFKRGYINFETQHEKLERVTTFVSARGAQNFEHRTEVHFEAYTVDEVVRRLRNRLKSIDADGGTRYSRTYSATTLRDIVRTSLKRIGEERDLVLEQNLQHAYRAIGITQRRSAKTLRIEREPDRLYSVNTRELPKRSIGIGSFRRDSTVFYDSESSVLSEDVDGRILDELTAADSPYPRSAAVEVQNQFFFKSPVNLVTTSHGPEREFVGRLFHPDVAAGLIGWIKSSDSGFYEIEYSWRKGDHAKQGRFNPDFFLKLSDESTVVIEIKDDDDVSTENVAKNLYATQHFDTINRLQDQIEYRFLFLSPKSYDGFFQSLLSGEVGTFRSSLQVKLES